MTDLRTAAQQALEALEQSETFVPYEGFGMARRKAESKHQAAITALRAALAEQRLTDMEQKMERSIESLKTALAEPVQEPDDGVCDGLRGGLCIHQDPSQCKPERDCPAFSAPPQRKPMNEFDALRLITESIGHLQSAGPVEGLIGIIRAVERAHGIT